CLYEISEPTNAPTLPLSHSPTLPPLFADVSPLLGHTHHELPFDDFQSQPTLERKLSQLGPGVAWIDFDGDGWDDLVIGTGKGGSAAFFRNDTKGGFIPPTAPSGKTPAPSSPSPLNGERAGVRGEAVPSASSLQSLFGTSPDDTTALLGWRKSETEFAL